MKRVLLLVLATSVAIFFYQENRPINPFQFTFPDHPEWDVQIKDVPNLKQEYTYLGEGARSTAYLSSDGQYVLKFFKNRYQTPHWSVTYLPDVFPFSWFRNKKVNKVSLEQVLSGYSLSYNRDPDGCGLLLVHLNAKNMGYPHVMIKDKSGNTQLINLNNTRFVLQKKVDELESLLTMDFKEGRVDSAIEKILLTFNLYKKHFQMGLFDTGVGFVRNNGFIDNTPIHFDVGKLTLSDQILNSNHQSEALKALISNLEAWMERKFPEFKDEVMKTIEFEVI